MALIDKDALVAEIERLDALYHISKNLTGDLFIEGLLSFLGTLEAKEDDKYEIPDIKTKDTIEVSSRMKYIDEDLKPIAEFIMNYASWNLHKDEWNQPVLEVPLFRVLDALAQRGKPYCCR